MKSLSDMVAVVCDSGGWQPVQPDSNGHYIFSFSNGPDMELFSPDGKNCILTGQITQIPNDRQEKARFLSEFARRAVAAMQTSPSVVSLNEKENIVCLHRIFPIVSLSSYEAPEIVEDFLNDLSWWQQQAKDLETPAVPFSPFSLLR